jgi:Mg-chelatase subunit ChlD
MKKVTIEEAKKRFHQISEQGTTNMAFGFKPNETSLKDDDERTSSAQTGFRNVITEGRELGPLETNPFKPTDNTKKRDTTDLVEKKFEKVLTNLYAELMGNNISYQDAKDIIESAFRHSLYKVENPQFYKK